MAIQSLKAIGALLVENGGGLSDVETTEELGTGHVLLSEIKELPLWELAALSG
jgi:hypothetical protein